MFFKLGLLNKIELNLLKLDSQIFPLLPTFYGLYMKEWKLPRPLKRKKNSRLDETVPHRFSARTFFPH